MSSKQIMCISRVYNFFKFELINFAIYIEVTQLKMSNFMYKLGEMVEISAVQLSMESEYDF